MITLNKNEQRIYEYWQNGVLYRYDELRGYGYTHLEALDDIAETSQEIMETDYNIDHWKDFELFPELKAILNEQLKKCDYGKIASKLAYEYIPSQRSSANRKPKAAKSHPVKRPSRK